MEGSGRLGNQPLEPVHVHYTSPQTPYGPIVSGGDGLTYCTIRAASVSDGFFMPESRALLSRRLTRTHLSPDRVTRTPRSTLGGLDRAEVDPLFEPGEDGVAAWTVQAPPDADLELPAHLHNGGQFVLVVGGGLDLAGAHVGPLGVAHLSVEEAGRRCRAGRDGVQLVLVQFPRANR
ncbi:hypothetical protein [Pseudonocardia halophobica]|uniref:hypothetical protein n=1 Tax=Pseudonocardia halophobica TaxID=29401 RepID=UPI000A44C1CD|nr:hypothetical protein [Pseudonocardia halophobica]